MNKENVRAKTRIPLPLAPLPPLPKHLVSKLSKRRPLNTLAGPNGLDHPVSSSNLLCMAGPSNSQTKIVLKEPKKTYTIDTKFVTVRRGCKDLNSVVYQDDKKRTSTSSVITISSDEENDTDQNDFHLIDKHGLANKKRLSASLPDLNALVPASGKNITPSSKIPHSRGRQGLTPLENQGRVHERMQSPDLFQRSYIPSMDTDGIQYLLHVETKPVALPPVNSETRSRIINWMMKINGTVGNPATIQAAVWYLDTVLATCNVPNNVQLEAAAAYLIASKHRGPRTRTSKLITCAGFAFTKEKLLEKELDILLTLKFPCQPVVPQDYICYFAWWCKEERAGEIEVASTFLCLCGMMVDKSLRPEYPSVVAAASVKNALLLLKRNELMPRLHRCPAFAAAEEKADNMIHTCVILRNAVREVASNNYTYMFILEQYGMPPKYIAQTLVDAARERSVMDSMITTQHV